jgi:tetratricopeptide (TPR) repeat protein
VDRDGAQLRPLRERGRRLRRPRRLAEEALSKDAQTHHRRAEILSDLGRLDRALDEAQAAIAADPDDSDGWFSAGRSLIHSGRDAEALEYIEKGLGREPRSSWGHRLRSVALTGLGRQVDALEAAEQAVNISPDQWRCYTRLARCYSRLRRHRDAEQAVAKAAEIHPEGAVIFTQWARVVWALEDAVRAEALARKGVALDPTSVDALRVLGMILHKQRPAKDREAFGVYARAMALDPTDAELRQRVIDTGFNELVVPPLIIGSAFVVLPLLFVLCAALRLPVILLALPLPIAVFMAVASVVYQRQAALLEQESAGGVDLFMRLWWPRK